MAYNSHSASDSIPPDQAKRLELVRGLYTYLNRFFLTDRFMNLKNDSKQNVEILLSNLNWAQLQRCAAYIDMLIRLHRPHDVKDLLKDKSLPKQLRLLLFGLLALNHQFDFKASRGLVRTYKRNVYQAIKHLPMQLAYEIAVTQLPISVSHHKRIRILYRRRDLNYLIFAHAVNDWQNFVSDRLHLWQVESYYRLAEHFIRKMNRKKYHKLTYVFAHGLVGTFPEVKGFNRFDAWRVQRIQRRWRALADQSRVDYLASVNMPINPAEFPDEWLKEIVELPDLDNLLPVGVWDARTNSLEFLKGNSFS